MNGSDSPGMGTAARLIVPAVVWVLRFSVSSDGRGPENLLSIVLDATLVVLHWWSVQPLRAADPDRFGRNDSATKFLFVPLLLALFFLLRDTWLGIGYRQ